MQEFRKRTRFQVISIWYFSFEIYIRYSTKSFYWKNNTYSTETCSISRKYLKAPIKTFYKRVMCFTWNISKFCRPATTSPLLNFEFKKLNKEESLSKTRFRFKFFKYNHNWTADFYEEMEATYWFLSSITNYGKYFILHIVHIYICISYALIFLWYRNYL